MGTKTQKLSNVVDQIVEWQSVVVADGSTNTTGVSGRGYFVDTSAGAHTVNLPASPKIGDVIKVSLITAGNALTIGRNGNNINGSASNITSSVDGDAYELVYVNASEGWKTIGEKVGGSFISATGGTVTTSGDFKIHTFTGDGCFSVSSTGNSCTVPTGGPAVVDYLVVAGGGGGGSGGGTSGGSGASGGGAGAGGYRESSGAASGCYSISPLGSGVCGITVTTTTYPITVGAGGASSSPGTVSGCGSPSSFSTITSTGGGGGGVRQACVIPRQCGKPGGSGGGGTVNVPGIGNGNTPPVSPPQGNPGGQPVGPNNAGGGGGGATAAGANATAGPPTPAADGGNGGAGATSSINGTPTTRAGGGGGGGSGESIDEANGGSGGPGGGGAGGNTGTIGNAGTANTGGGGGGGGANPGKSGAAGGKGIVIIRYKFQ